MRPKSLDHLLAVQPIAGREGKQLDHTSGPPMPPRGCGQRAAVDLHFEPTEQLDLYARHLLPVCTRDLVCAGLPAACSGSPTAIYSVSRS